MNKDIVKRQQVARRRRSIRKKISGTSETPRLAVYRSECHIYGQLIDDVAGKTLVAASTLSRELRDSVKGLKPVEQATKVGEHLAEKAAAAGIKDVVFDRGGRRYAGRVAALADGARSKGLQF